MLFPQQFLDDLRLQANIVQVIQDYVTLRRVGGKYKGLCPFHAEKTPSFSVDPDKGFFHCFGCHAGGDVLKFLELHERVGFQEAVRMLAQKFGIPVPETVPGSSEQAAGAASLRENLLKVHELAAAYFREQLAGPTGSRARRQLDDRGVDGPTIEQLGLGYAPAGGLAARLRETGVSEVLLLQSGLGVKRDAGEVVDRFRNRLMVPICRDTGPVIAFGGRAMEPDQVPKYLNSPETPIYSKGRTLYGLSLTKSAIREQKFAVLVEGYFDFAQVFRTRAAPVVAACGTALTPQQAQLLRRFTSKVVLSYDPDAAGQGAAARSSELLVREGFEVNVAVLDKDEDPDTFIRRHGAGRYQERLRNSQPFLEFLLDAATRAHDLSRPEGRRAFVDEMLPIAHWIPDPVGRDQFGDRIAHKGQITEEVVRAEIRKAAVVRRTAVTDRELPSFGPVKYAEKGLIWALIHNASAAVDALAELDPEDLNNLAAPEVFQVARSLLHQNRELVPSTLLERLSTCERPACHPHRRFPHTPGPGARMRPGAPPDAVGARARCHSR